MVVVGVGFHDVSHALLADDLGDDISGPTVSAALARLPQRRYSSF